MTVTTVDELTLVVLWHTAQALANVHCPTARRLLRKAEDTVVMLLVVRWVGMCTPDISPEANRVKTDTRAAMNGIGRIETDAS